MVAHQGFIKKNFFVFFSFELKESKVPHKTSWVLSNFIFSYFRWFEILDEFSGFAQVM